MRLSFVGGIDLLHHCAQTRKIARLRTREERDDALADSAAQVEEAVAGALAAGRPAIVDVRVDPEALYSFRRDSFKHRGSGA